MPSPLDMEFCLTMDANSVEVWHIGDPRVATNRNLRCESSLPIYRRTRDLVAVERSKLPWCAACDATLWASRVTGRT